MSPGKLYVLCVIASIAGLPGEPAHTFIVQRPSGASTGFYPLSQSIAQPGGQVVPGQIFMIKTGCSPHTSLIVRSLFNSKHLATPQETEAPQGRQTPAKTRLPC
jgi:hypothetical protein